MPTKFHLTRRAAVLGLAGTLAMPSLGWALTTKSASNLIDRLVGDINAIINSGKSESLMYVEFERIFAKYGDVPIIARSSLGVAWRAANSSQQSAYVAAFRGYMARKYGKRFRKFIGGKIVVKDTKQVSSGYLVASIAYLQGSAPFAVDWQVSDKSGQIKMFNMYIEGISLLATERTEIAAMLDRNGGDIGKLIKVLKTAS